MHLRALVLIFFILAAGTALLAQSPFDTLQPGSVQPGLMMRGNASHTGDIDNLGSITGSLLTIDDRPVHNAQIELQDVNTGAFIASTTSKMNGSFGFYNVPLGQFEVVANRGVDQAHELVQIDNGPTQITLRIRGAQSEPDAGDTISVAALQVPDKAKKEFRKASAAFLKRKYEEAENHTNKALRILPNYSQALTLQGLLKIGRGDVSGGEQSLQAAIHSDPNYPLAYFAMGAAYNGSGKFANAQQTVQEGLRIDPASWQGYFELSKSLLGQRDFRNALKNVVKAESFGAAYAPIHLVKAHALLGLRDYDEATSELERYLSSDSKGPAADEARRELSQAKAFSTTASE
jgi:tetratricopeptide (TPR) repeat protein